MATVGSLIVDLVANTASFISGMKSSQQMVVDFKRTAGGGFTLNIDASKATDTLTNLHSMLDAFAGESGSLREATDQIGEFADSMNKARDATQSLQDVASKFGPVVSTFVQLAREAQAFTAAVINQETAIINYRTTLDGMAPDTAFNREAKQIEQQNQRDQARIDEANKSVSAFNDAVSKGPAAFMQQLQDNQRFAGLNEREQVWQRMMDSFKDVPGATDAYKKSFADAALAAYDETEARKAAKEAADEEAATRKQARDTINATGASAAIDLLFGGIPGLDLAGLRDVTQPDQQQRPRRSPSALQFGSNAAFTAEGNQQQVGLDLAKQQLTIAQKQLTQQEIIAKGQAAVQAVGVFKIK